jgi:hypothetical protein
VRRYWTGSREVRRTRGTGSTRAQGLPAASVLGNSEYVARSFGYRMASKAVEGRQGEAESE